MVSLSAGALSVRYSKLRDRLSHTIGISHRDHFLPILESVEGTELEPWPVSPPMQQMVEESFVPGASPVLLGVGLSGNGHWSTAIETQSEQLLKFDVACKNSQSSSWFGSEYRVLTHATLGTWNESATLLMELDNLVARIEIAAPIGQILCSIEEKIIRISPCSEPASIRTHRWCYEVKLLRGDWTPGRSNGNKALELLP